MENDLLNSADFYRRRLQDEALWATPGTRQHAESIEAQDREGSSFGGAFVLGVEQTAAADAYRVLRDEGTLLAEHYARDARDPEEDLAFRIAGYGAALFGVRHGEADYDKDAEYENLTAGIPIYLHKEIMGNDNLAAAKRARGRIMQEFERGRKMMHVTGVDNLAFFAGSILDLDAPLMFATGGGYGAAKVSRTALMTAEALRLSPGGAKRLSSVAVGANSGMQAGAIVGAAESAWDETKDWTNIAEVAIYSTMFGASLNGVLKGDAMLAAREAHNELISRVSSNDPSLKKQPPVDPEMAQPIRPARKPVVQAIDEADEASTVGAREAEGSEAARMDNENLVDPQGRMSETSQEIITGAKEWKHNSGWGSRKEDESTEFWARVALHPAANLTTNNFRRLYISRSSVLNWLAGNVFESPTGLGRGGYTAAAGQEFFHRRIYGPIGQDFADQAKEWALRNNSTWGETGFGISTAGARQFNREVMLEMNARAHGRPGTQSPQVRRAADALERSGQEALEIGRGRPGEHAVDGFDGIPDRRGYMPYHWNGGRINEVETAGQSNRRNIEEGFRRAYIAAGMPDEFAAPVARAVVHRAVARDSDFDTNLVNLLSGDGREWLRQSLERSGMPQSEVQGLLRRLTGSLEERGREGFAKSRNEIDLNTPIKTLDGSDLRIVDLLDNDVMGVWQKYSRSMAGAASLARVGITNRMQRQQIIDAAQAEQRALGEEPVSADILNSMFSHFNGGPIHGVGLGQKLEEGIGAEWIAMRRATSLSLLGKMGLAQLAETGATIAQLGMRTWWDRSIAPIFDRVKANEKQQLLDEMAFLVGEVGMDHVHLAPWMDLDNVSRADRGDWLNSVNKLGAKAQWVQGYTSMFNHVRKYQQQVAAVGLMDKVFRELRNGLRRDEAAYEAYRRSASWEGDDLDAFYRRKSDQWTRRMQGDLGLDPEFVRRLEQLVTDGTIQFRTRGGSTYVNRLNLDQWDPEMLNTFASAITRNQNQLVQKSMAGEEDAWMHTAFGTLITHLKTFPLQAIQKQFIRNMRYSDNQTLATALYGMGTAALAIKIRDLIDGKERSDTELARSAFGYSNLTGWVPMLADPALTMLGLEDWRINPYGEYSSLRPPAFDWIDNAIRIPGAALDVARGTQDYYDEKALKALPWANTMILSRSFDGIHVSRKEKAAEKAKSQERLRRFKEEPETIGIQDVFSLSTDFLHTD